MQVIPPISEKHEKDAALYRATGKLIINNLQKKKDLGYYKCIVVDDLHNRNQFLLKLGKIIGKYYNHGMKRSFYYKIFMIQIFPGPHDYFIDLKEPTNRLTVTVKSANKTTEKPLVAKWLVKYVGHPTPTVVWRDLHGNEVPWITTEDFSRKLNAFIDGPTTTLKINDPRITDSGYYTLYADNGRLQKDQKFQLLVQGIHTDRRILRIHLQLYKNDSVKLLNALNFN